MYLILGNKKSISHWKWDNHVQFYFFIIICIALQYIPGQFNYLGCVENRAMDFFLDGASAYFTFITFQCARGNMLTLAKTL